MNLSESLMPGWQFSRGAMHRAGIAVWLALFMVALWAMPAAAQGNRVSDLACYAVADERDFNDQDLDNPADTLTVLDPATGDTQIIGLTGTENIEAMTFGPNNEIFAANGGRLGTLDKTTGVFTPRPLPFGIAGGALDERSLFDVDGLAFDLDQNILFGVHRRFDSGDPQEELNPDLLFAINPTTGAHIPNFFGPEGGPFTDYVVIPEVQDDEGNSLTDIDDIQFDPVNATLYGVANAGGASGLLITIDVETGAATPIATFRDTNTNEIVDDIEGISFGNDGTLYVSTGDNFLGDFDDLNSLFVVDALTAQSTLVGPFPDGPKDYEAIACLSAEAAIVLRKLTNGPGQTPQDADDPTGPQIEVGDEVTWTYIFTNTGVLTLTDFSLVDDKVGAIGPSSTCVPAGTVLAPGNSLTCTATGIAIEGQYSNTATITADSIPTQLFPMYTVTDSNPSHYIGVVVPPLPATLGDRVWEDLNGNGVQDDGEPGVPGVTVTLLTEGCSTSTGLSTVTDEDGLYVFDDLEPGSYCVQFTLPTGFAFTTPNVGDDATDSDADPDSGISAEVTLVENEENLTVDAGLVADASPLVAVGDLVWFDANQNGLQDGIGTEGGEQGVPNVQVNLFPVQEESVSAAGIAAAQQVSFTLTTDANGRYLFTDLPPGDYYVEFIGPADFGFTIPDAEGNTQDDRDSDAQVPLMTVDVRDDVDDVEPGQTVTYTILYTNTHPTFSADGAVISTTVPASTTFDAAGSSAGWSCDDATEGSVCSFTLGSVAPNGAGSVQFAVRLAETDGDDLPPAVFILVRLIQAKQANTQIVTVPAGQDNLTLDAGLVPIASAGDVEAGEDTPTTIEPTNLPPGAQPQQNEFIFLPSLNNEE